MDSKQFIKNKQKQQDIARKLNFYFNQQDLSRDEIASNIADLVDISAARIKALFGDALRGKLHITNGFASEHPLDQYANLKYLPHIYEQVKVPETDEMVTWTKELNPYFSYGTQTQEKQLTQISPSVDLLSLYFRK